jgi:hypothetical protein
MLVASGIDVWFSSLDSCVVKSTVTDPAELEHLTKGFAILFGQSVTRLAVKFI